METAQQDSWLDFYNHPPKRGRPPGYVRRRLFEPETGSGPDCLTSCEVLDMFRDQGLTYRRLDHWVRIGLIEGQGYIGSGVPRGWTPAQVERVRRILVALARAKEILDTEGIGHFIKQEGRRSA